MMGKFSRRPGRSGHNSVDIGVHIPGQAATRRANLSPTERDSPATPVAYGAASAEFAVLLRMNKRHVNVDQNWTI
jgi:hypothetical protein